MDKRNILDVDMATLARLARDGLSWWLDELAQMCPQWLLRGLKRRWPVVIWDGADGLDAEGTVLPPRAELSSRAELPPRAELHGPAGAVLIRQLVLPAMSRRDLQAAVQLEADRLMPLPAADMLLTAEPVAAAANGTEGRVAVAGISRKQVERLLALLDARGVEPVALVAEADGLRFDFLPPARAAGLLPARVSPAHGWWAVVAILFVMNVATLVWRDVDRVERLQAEVDARAPIALAAQKAAQRIQAGALIAHDQATQRQTRDPLQALAEVTEALPTAAWVQRWAWDGRNLRISGYKRGPVDVLQALRDSRRFADVRNASSEVQAEIPVGQPFDLLIRLREQ